MSDVIRREALVEAMLPEHWTVRWDAKDNHGDRAVTVPFECALEIASAPPSFYSAKGNRFIHGSG